MSEFDNQEDEIIELTDDDVEFEENLENKNKVLNIDELEDLTEEEKENLKGGGEWRYAGVHRTTVTLSWPGYSNRVLAKGGGLLLKNPKRIGNIIASQEGHRIRFKRTSAKKGTYTFNSYELGWINNIYDCYITVKCL